MSIQWFGILVFFAFGAATIGVLYLWLWTRNLRQFRRPVREKMLRPAGTSLRTQIESTEEDFWGRIFLAIFAPPIFAATWAMRGALAQPVELSQGFWGILLGLSIWIPSSFWLIRHARHRSNLFLGYSGEMAVAEQLQELVRQGCYVFHDLQPENTWNIDHIVVAPDSVLVIETKTRRKRDTHGPKAHEIIFDGRVLHFPDWSDTQGLDQAERNAVWVREYLSKALAEPVKVEPVLTMPGWLIKREGRGAVYVVNPKEIRALVRARGAHAISPEKEKRMRQIAHALEQKCRDIEF